MLQVDGNGDSSSEDDDDEEEEYDEDDEEEKDKDGGEDGQVEEVGVAVVLSVGCVARLGRNRKLKVSYWNAARFIHHMHFL